MQLPQLKSLFRFPIRELTELQRTDYGIAPYREPR